MVASGMLKSRYFWKYEHPTSVPSRKMSSHLMKTEFAVAPCQVRTGIPVHTDMITLIDTDPELDNVLIIDLAF